MAYQSLEGPEMIPFFQDRDGKGLMGHMREDRYVDSPSVKVRLDDSGEIYIPVDPSNRS
jgi:hypothetical protein